MCGFWLPLRSAIPPCVTTSTLVSPISETAIAAERNGNLMQDVLPREDVYVAVDRMVGALERAAPDARVLAFSMHGMGPNESDVPSMVLLPELLHRWNFGEPMLDPRPSWSDFDPPMLAADELRWDLAVHDRLRHRSPTRAARIRSRLGGRRAPLIPESRRSSARSVEWIPATQYRDSWPETKAFALPAYYHGRVRVNLRGREARGRVADADYERVCDEVTELVMSCKNPRTGDPAALRVERFVDRSPHELGETDADLEIVWAANAVELYHPDHGRIGPVPHRRTGGHTGAHGIAYLSEEDAPSGAVDGGVRSSFDVIPTLFDLMGQRLPDGFSGRSLVDSVA